VYGSTGRCAASPDMRPSNGVPAARDDDDGTNVAREPEKFNRAAIQLHEDGTNVSRKAPFAC
jgi:hypothetical protein